MSSISIIGPRLTPLYPAWRISPIRRKKRAETERIVPPEEAFRFGNNHKWAIENEQKGRLAYVASITGLIAGTGQSFFIKKDEDDPNVIANTFNLINTLSGVIAGREMYEIYGRDDDDVGMHRVEGELYNNVTSVGLGEWGCTFERKVGPIVKTAAYFLDSNTQEAVNEVVSLPSTSWWLGKPVPFINQQIGTHALQFVTNFIPALFGNEKAREVIKEIEEEKILSLSYIGDRIKSLFGYKETKISSKNNFSKYLLSTVHDLTSLDISKRKDATRYIYAGIAPILGGIGFLTLSIFSPIKLVLKLIGIEVKKLNILSSLNRTFQDILYALNFTAQEKIKILELKQQHASKSQIKDHELLYKTSLVSNVANIALPAVESIKSENEWIVLFKALWKLFADKGRAIFFAKRRQIMGKEWLASNKVKNI